MDGKETAIDCGGGDCRACKPEGRFPRSLLLGILIILALLLLMPISKMHHEDIDVMRNMRELAVSGEKALKAKNRKKAENNYRKMKWLYIQIEGRQHKRKMLGEMQAYHRKIKRISEF